MTSLTNIAKQSASLEGLHTFGILSYIFTDGSDYVLVGADEDENLIWQEDFSMTNASKITTSLTNANK